MGRHTQSGCDSCSWETLEGCLVWLQLESWDLQRWTNPRIGGVFTSDKLHRNRLVPYASLQVLAFHKKAKVRQDQKFCLWFKVLYKRCLSVPESGSEIIAAWHEGRTSWRMHDPSHRSIVTWGKKAEMVNMRVWTTSLYFALSSREWEEERGQSGKERGENDRDRGERERER